MEPEANARLRGWETARRAFLFALAILLLGFGCPAYAQDLAKRLLIVYPDSSESHAAVLAGEAVRGRLAQAAGGLLVQTHTEFLDRTQFPGQEHKDRFVRYLNDKYSASKPNAILAFGADSLEAAQNYRKLVDANIPIV